METRSRITKRLLALAFAVCLALPAREVCAAPPPGILVLASAGVALDPDASAYISAIIAAGGTLSTAEQGYINTFITSAKGGSNPWWSTVTLMNVLMGNPTSGSGVAPYLVQYEPGTGAVNAVNHNFIYTDCVETGSGGGIKGASTKYLDTGFNPSSAGSSTSSFGIHCYTTGLTGTGSVLMGNSDGTHVTRIVYLGSLMVFYLGNNASVAQSSPSTSGMWSSINNGTTSYLGYYNGSSVTTSAVVIAFGNNTLFVSAENVSSTPSLYNFGSTCFYAITLGQTAAQNAQMYTNVLALQTSLGRN